MSKITFGGTKTHNLRLKRSTPSPLGHKGTAGSWIFPTDWLAFAWRYFIEEIYSPYYSLNPS